ISPKLEASFHSSSPARNSGMTSAIAVSSPAPDTSRPTARRTSVCGSDTGWRTPLREDDEDVALLHRLIDRDGDRLHGARRVGFDGHLHLHRLQHDDHVALRDLLPDRALDAEDLADHRRGDLVHGPGILRG